MALIHIQIALIILSLIATLFFATDKNWNAKGDLKFITGMLFIIVLFITFVLSAFYLGHWLYYL